MILVTGGSGFIGSALIWGLNQQGHSDIIVADHLGLGDKWQNLSKRQIDFVIPKEQLFAWLEAAGQPKFEAVIHLGACSATTERNADYLMENNVLFSQRLWNYCTSKSIPFLYASSAATYGAEERCFSDDHSFITSLRPINKYGWSKHLFDAWAIKQQKTPPFWFGFKYFNVYGPQEYHKGLQASVVLHAAPQVREAGRLRLFKSYRPDCAHGEQQRDFIYVKDVVKVMLYFWLGRHSIPSGIYNLGTGKARSFIDLGQAVFKAYDQTPQWEWIDMPQTLRHQYQYFTEASLDKLRQVAGYQEDFYSLEAGVTDYVQNFLNQADPYL